MIIGLLLLVVLAFGSYKWLQEHDARVKAEAVVSSEQIQIDAAKKDEAKTQADLDTRLAALEAQKKLPATAPQIVLDASHLFPNLPQPLQVVTPPPTTVVSNNGTTTTVPGVPVVQIPQVDFAAFQAGAIACQENSAKLDACSITLADTKSELASTTKQRDADETALKGGTFWTRLGTGMKHAGCGAAGSLVGVGVSQANGSNPVNGLIGGTATFGGCEFVSWLIGRTKK